MHTLINKWEDIEGLHLWEGDRITFVFNDVNTGQMRFFRASIWDEGVLRCDHCQKEIVEHDQYVWGENPYSFYHESCRE